METTVKPPIRKDEADYYVRKLKSVKVCNKMLQNFYKSVVESALTTSII